MYALRLENPHGIFLFSSFRRGNNGAHYRKYKACQRLVFDVLWLLFVLEMLSFQYCSLSFSLNCNLLQQLKILWDNDK